MQDILAASNKTLAISCTSTASTSQSLPGYGSIVRLVNEGPNNAYVSIGSGTQTATLPPTSNPTVTCLPVLAGADVIFSVGVNQPPTGLNISAVCRASETATLLVQCGEGL